MTLGIKEKPKSGFQTFVSVPDISLVMALRSYQKRQWLGKFPLSSPNNCGCAYPCQQRPPLIRKTFYSWFDAWWKIRSTINKNRKSLVDLRNLTSFLRAKMWDSDRKMSGFLLHSPACSHQASHTMVSNGIVHIFLVYSQHILGLSNISRDQWELSI